MTTDTVAAAGRAYLLLTFTALCWGANAVFGRLAVGEISPMLLVGLRWLGVMLLLLAFARRQLRRDWPTLRRHLVFTATIGVLGFTAFNALFYLAAYSTTAVNIGILQGSIPVIVLIGAFVAYRTRVTRLQILGVVVTLLGVATVATGGDMRRLATLTLNRGDLLMLAACAFYATYTVALKRRPPVAALSLFAVMSAAALLASLPLIAAEVVLDKLRWPTVNGWIIVALITLFPSLLAQLAFLQGVKLLGPGRAGVFVNLVPVFASLLAVLVLKEPFEVFHAVALCLVLGGIWLSERGKAG